MRTYTSEQVDCLLDEIEERINSNQERVKIVDDLADDDDIEEDDIDIEDVLFVECCHKNLKEIRRDRDFIIKRRLGT